MTSRCVPLTGMRCRSFQRPGHPHHSLDTPAALHPPPPPTAAPPHTSFPACLSTNPQPVVRVCVVHSALQTEDESASAYHRVGWQGSIELTDAWASTAARTARHNTQGRLQCSPLDRDLCHISHSQLPRRLLQWCLFVFYFTRAFYGRQPYAWAAPRSLKYSHINSPNDTTPESPPPYKFSTRTCS